MLARKNNLGLCMMCYDSFYGHDASMWKGKERKEKLNDKLFDLSMYVEGKEKERIG